MSEQEGWRPLKERPRSNPAAFVVSPFARLARTHALMVAGDALIALALAGSLFFSIDPSDARWRVGLYLLLTMAPFAVVAPLIGPYLDRIMGGRRWMIIGSGLVRAVVAFIMFRHLDSLLLFPEAFTMLVLGKGYHVAKSAMVPAVITDDSELVEANSKLSLLSGVAGAVALAPGGLVMLIGGPQWVCILAGLAFAGSVVVGLKLPSAVVAAEPADEAERAELRGAGILVAASAMGVLRGLVGFLTFLIAFTLRGTQERPFVGEFGSRLGAQTRDLLGETITTISTGAPTWHFGVAAGLAGIGGPLGAITTPQLRRTVTEERILVGALSLVVVGCLAGALIGGVVGAGLAAFSVSFAASSGKLAFDSILQRDAPDANRGRSFARFETRFQLAWVLGAAIPVVIAIPGRIGYLMIAAGAAFAAGSYVVGRRFLLAHGRLRPRKTDEVADRIKATAREKVSHIRETATLRLQGRVGAKAEQAPEPEPVIEAASEPEPEAQPELEAESEQEPAPETEEEPEPEAESETDPESELEEEPAPEPEPSDRS